MKIDFFKFQKLLIILSTVLVGLSLFWMGKGLNYGTDFVGGVEMTFSVKGIRDMPGDDIANLFLQRENPISVQVEKIVAANPQNQRYILRSVFLGETDGTTLESTEDELSFILATEYGDAYVKEVTRSIGGIVSSENRSNAIWITLVVMLMIVSYVGLRFQSLGFGLATIVAVVHDVLLMLGLIAFFNIEMNILIVVAILTIFGYSVNDTIVLFDRVRENLRNTDKPNFKIILNQSINQILVRSLVTSLTTLIVVFLLYSNTTGSYQNFTFVLMGGLVSGTYSSIYIATTFILLWNRLNLFKKFSKKAPVAQQ